MLDIAICKLPTGLHLDVYWETLVGDVSLEQLSPVQTVKHILSPTQSYVSEKLKDLTEVLIPG